MKLRLSILLFCLIALVAASQTAIVPLKFDTLILR
jgi:hypothetical protein